MSEKKRVAPTDLGLPRIEDMPVWANRKQIEELKRLMPERAKEIDELWDEGLTREQADEVLKVRRAWLAAHPRLAARRVGEVSLAKAWELHGQSEEVLKQRERDELLRERERDYRIGSRQAGGRLRGDPEMTARDKYQAALDRVAERRLADAEYERSLRENYDPIEAYDRGVIWGGRR
jgi:hypothetical protein